MSLGSFDRTPPPFFRQGPSALSKMMFFTALAVLLMVADTRFKVTLPLRAAVATALLPIERVLMVPVSITALNVVRQALALADGTQRDAVPFVLRGKLAGGAFGAVRFSQEGSIGIASLLPRAAR